MTCVCVKAPIRNCCGKSYAAGDVADIPSQHAEFFRLQNIVSEAVNIDMITCAGLVCGRVCNPKWKVKIELDVGATGENDYEVELTPRADGSFGGDIRDIAGPPPPVDPDADPNDPPPEGETAPLEIQGETRRITVSVAVGGDCGVIAKQVECIVGSENDPCAQLHALGSC